MQTFSFQAPEELKARLEAFARKFDRSQGYLMRQALEEYLNDLEDYLEAKRIKETYNPEENVSFEELKKRHGLD